MTPVGSPEVAVLLKPLSTTAVVPSPTFVAVGKTSIRASIVEPPLRVKRGVKFVGVA
ncbi:hypothetical protein [Polymorphobacter multimanifer]|uniref:hypothetical protein n=1 Tax=Polymorphobacter multimanifer TaxID=1070431 RepID=UPI001FB129FE|nr:hypothetical protein [Polymorphobacter multimanifer]